MEDESRVYQRIGEFVVSFQWIENKLREIGWFIIDPERVVWPPEKLRNIRNEELVDRVHEMFIQAISKCALGSDQEQEFKVSFDSCAKDLHELRISRNNILHSAFIEFKAGGVVQGLLRSSPKMKINEESGEPIFDQEFLTPDSFEQDMKKMGEAAFFLNRAYTQLIHRYPQENA
ncbi:hypothetical protein [Alteromonas stellipolaris]|uniref:hypothetical protein n=1 Tax=Alteromonas stellipolaris TaxID=233316 RepID=UPI002734354C|nr:hypothetical protein [Alteromonas stellipolaris]MDP2594823.1 hypothetical protein [Alteromonas stellipolaris]